MLGYLPQAQAANNDAPSGRYAKSKDRVISDEVNSYEGDGGWAWNDAKRDNFAKTLIVYSKVKLFLYFCS